MGEDLKGGGVRSPVGGGKQSRLNREVAGSSGGVSKEWCRTGHMEIGWEREKELCSVAARSSRRNVFHEGIARCECSGGGES